MRTIAVGDYDGVDLGPFIAWCDAEGIPTSATFQVDVHDDGAHVTVHQYARNDEGHFYVDFSKNSHEAAKADPIVMPIRSLPPEPT